MKFVTPNSDLRDIRDNLIIDFDLHHRFFANRLLRIAMFVQEFQLDRDVYSAKLGNSLLKGYDRLESFEQAREEFLIYVQREETWQDTRKMLRKTVRTETDTIEPAVIDGMKMLKVKFRRIYKKSTRRYQNVLKGYSHKD